MTKGLAFLVCMLIEGAVATLLGILLSRQFNLSRFGAAVRCGAAAVIGTAATNPAIWAGFSRLEGWTGTWWGAAALSEAAVVLVETLFYAAALRGHWRWSLVISIIVNAMAFGAGVLFSSGLPRPT
ncbi:MAG TPA: hypothetical protein VJ822_08685 [Dongiaceae bacterium]|nr:hypothetical protein [Dongiaceae bacterium]